ncbi:MAG: glutamate--tRNA ligase, partial [Gelidibacter sp.]
KAWIGKKEVGFGKVMQPLRLALVGAMQGPDVFEIIYMIGQAETVKRIENLVQAL